MVNKWKEGQTNRLWMNVKHSQLFLACAHSPYIYIGTVMCLLIKKSRVGGCGPKWSLDVIPLIYPLGEGGGPASRIYYIL